MPRTRSDFPTGEMFSGTEAREQWQRLMGSPHIEERIQATIMEAVEQCAEQVRLELVALPPGADFTQPFTTAMMAMMLGLANGVGNVLLKTPVRLRPVVSDAFNGAMQQILAHLREIAEAEDERRQSGPPS